MFLAIDKRRSSHQNVQKTHSGRPLRGFGSILRQGGQKAAAALSDLVLGSIPEKGSQERPGSCEAPTLARAPQPSFSCFALEFFFVRLSIFHFFFPFFTVFGPGKRREEGKGKLSLSLFVSFESHVLPVLRRQAVDLLLHRGRGLLRRVQCEVRKRKREKNAANDERLFEDLT